MVFLIAFGLIISILGEGETAGYPHHWKTSAMGYSKMAVTVSVKFTLYSQGQGKSEEMYIHVKEIEYGKKQK